MQPTSKNGPMKTTVFLSAFIFCFVIFSHGQSSSGCLPEGITFTTLAEIDIFHTNYPGCTEIEGDVTILDLTSHITNLNGLSVLTSIGGNLNINAYDLYSLTGLSSLTSIGSGFSICGLSIYCIVGGKAKETFNHE
jgi:hypothetical protein